MSLEPVPQQRSLDIPGQEQSETAARLLDLIYGRWRSQIIYAGAKLGVFDVVASDYTDVVDIATKLQVDEKLLYRLLRALSSLGLLVENDSAGFAITDLGKLLKSDNETSLRNRILLVEGPEHYAIWKHLPDIIMEGRQDGFVREFGAPAFNYAKTNQRYRSTFDEAMTAISVAHSRLVLEALPDYCFDSVQSICDVGGGQGHLMCRLLMAYPQLSGIVLDLNDAFAHREDLWANKLGLEDRCKYVAGDMFIAVPAADAYFLKMILHDWNDRECMEILSVLRKHAEPGARVFIVEHLVPGPNQPHFAKLSDIHMMCWGGGRERTKEEFAELLASAGWTYRQTWSPKHGAIGVVEGRGPA